MTAADTDVHETNSTSANVTVTDQSQSQDLDNYSIWTARMKEVSKCLCIVCQNI